MASAFVHRIKNIAALVALSAILTAVTAGDFWATRRTDEARAATERQPKKDLADERTTCQRWGARGDTVKFTACIADLKDVRVKHDSRQAADLGNRRDGLTIVF